jgi:leader peptidase (prepilin peptidase) / N-methyltransferase
VRCDFFGQGGAEPDVSAAPIILPLWLDLTAGLVLGLMLLRIAMVDAATRRIPDMLSLPLIGLGLGLAALSLTPALADRLIGAGTGFLVMAALGEAFFRWRHREGLGLGDAKLFGAAGAWLGWQALPLVLVLASGAALIWALVRRQRSLAFGPWLALAFWLIWAATLIQQG